MDSKTPKSKVPMKTYLTDFGGKDVKKEESDQRKENGGKEKTNGQSALTAATFGLFGVKKGLTKSDKEEKENKNRKIGESKQTVEVGDC